MDFEPFFGFLFLGFNYSSFARLFSLTAVSCDAGSVLI